MNGRIILFPYDMLIARPDFSKDAVIDFFEASQIFRKNNLDRLSFASLNHFIWFVILGKKGKKKKGKTLNLNEFLLTGDSKQGANFAKKKAVDIEETEKRAGRL